MSLMVGKAAPEFSAMAYADGDFKKVSLEDYKGKWVAMIFYPADFTFVCPTELVAVAKQYEFLSSHDVEVLAISTDTHFVHKMWNEVELNKMIEGGLPFPMLNDAGGRIGQNYGVYDEESGLDMRGTFIIDPDGVLQSIQVTTPGVGRSAKELVRQIKAFQFTRQNEGKVAPSDWEEGEKTLDPSLNLVGHVCDVMPE